jgi:hypothetical protein
MCMKYVDTCVCASSVLLFNTVKVRTYLKRIGTGLNTSTSSIFIPFYYIDRFTSICTSVHLYYPQDVTEHTGLSGIPDEIRSLPDEQQQLEGSLQLAGEADKSNETVLIRQSCSQST